MEEKEKNQSSKEESRKEKCRKYLIEQKREEALRTVGYAILRMHELHYGEVTEEQYNRVVYFFKHVYEPEIDPIDLEIMMERDPDKVDYLIGLKYMGLYHNIPMVDERR